MGNFTKVLIVIAMVSLSESRAWYAPNGQDDVADPPSSQRGQRYEEEDEFGVEVFSPRLGRAKTRPSTTTPAPPVKARTTTSAPSTTAPPPRPSYDKPAPPRRVINHAYGYPEFVAAPNPAPPLGQSYFGVDLGSLSNPEELGSGHETVTPPPATTQTPGAASVTAEEIPTAPVSAEKGDKPSSTNAAFVLQLIKVMRWPVVALILTVVLGSCLLSGCSVGQFGQQCFETNAHRQTLRMISPRMDHDVTGAGLSQAGDF